MSETPVTINFVTLTTPGDTDTNESTMALAAASDHWEALRNHRFDAAMRGIMVFRPWRPLGYLQHASEFNASPP